MKLRFALTILVVVGQWIFFPATTQAHPASGIVVDRTGNIYFSDLETIWKFDTHGKLTVFRKGERGRHVHELAIDEQDNLYGADVSYNPATKGWISDVWKMTPEGKLIYLLEPTEHPPRGMSIWRDRAGNMYFIDQNNHTKRETLLLRRSPEGIVTTFAGSAYGHADGKGNLAKFSSVGGMAFGSDGSLYLSDGAAVRKVTTDGTVTTIAKGLDFRTSHDQPRFMAGLSGSLYGLSVDASGDVYVADAGNRRLLKIDSTGGVEVVSRAEPPYFPTGVAAAGGNLYVLEVGFTLPNLSSGPRVRKITADGKSTILTTIGENGRTGKPGSSLALQAGTTAERVIVFFSRDGRVKYTLAFITVGLFSLVALIWRRRRLRA
jgi:sugar lactone lactonase YvrE